MNNQDNTELIEVVLGLLEKSKQQDESIQKAIKALESEKTALETLRSDFKGVVRGQVGGECPKRPRSPYKRIRNANKPHRGSNCPLATGKKGFGLA